MGWEGCIAVDCVYFLFSFLKKIFACILLKNFFSFIYKIHF